ncbi:MAG: membrane integrity-associated transporter subunit PqiC [Acidobacteriota bacterium]|nr:membrane integrity-associated transporter subunit PqiC [Acidobacteriota bacterium]
MLANLMAAAAALILCSCGATRPIEYFTLNTQAPPVGSAPVGSGSVLPVTILVGRITASHLYLDDPIVYSDGGVELGTYEYHRWAEFPTEMIATILTGKLRSEGYYRSVARLGSGAKGDYILRGHLFSLEEVDSPSFTARFSIELELFQPKTGLIVWTRSYTHDEPVSGKTVAAVVEALRRNATLGLAQLSSNLHSYLLSVSPR